MVSDTKEDLIAAALPTIRGFIAASVGYDGGEVMTTQAREFAALLVDCDLLKMPNGGEQQACGANDSAVLDRIRHVLHDNNLGCTDTPGKHHVVAEQILAAVREVSS